MLARLTAAGVLSLALAGAALGQAPSSSGSAASPSKDRGDVAGAAAPSGAASQRPGGTSTASRKPKSGATKGKTQDQTQGQTQGQTKSGEGNGAGGAESGASPSGPG